MSEKVVIEFPGGASLLGKDGAGWLFGDGIPSPDVGRTGDSYVENATRKIYRKVDGAWIDTGQTVASEAALQVLKSQAAEAAQQASGSAAVAVAAASTTTENKVLAEAAAGLAVTSKGVAQTAAGDATSALAAIQALLLVLATPPFPSVEAGISGTDEGDYFLVYGDATYATIYMHGAADEPVTVFAFPSKSALDAGLVAMELVSLALAPLQLATKDRVDIPDSTPVRNGRFQKISDYVNPVLFNGVLAAAFTRFGQFEVTDFFAHRLRMPMGGPVPVDVPPITIPGIGVAAFALYTRDGRPFFVTTLKNGTWGIDPSTGQLARIDGSGGSGVQETYANVGGLTYNTDPNVLYVFLIGPGQSLEAAQSSGGPQPILSGTPTYPDSAFMMKNGIGTPHVCDGGGNAYVLADEIVPLAEAATANTYETRASGLANEFIRRHEAAVGWRPKVLVMVAGRGGARYDFIRRGSSVDTACKNAVKKLMKIVAARGLGERVVVFGEFTNHGQQDAADGVKAGTFRRFVLHRVQHANADYPRITNQSEPVRVFYTQIARQGTTSGPAVSTYPEISMGISQAAAMDGRLIVVGPAWQFEGAPGDSEHWSSLGQNTCGRTEAYAAVEELLSHGLPTFEIVETWRPSSTTTRFRYSRKFAIDTTGSHMPLPSPLAACGFVLSDNRATALAISAVNQIDDYVGEIVHAEPNGLMLTLYLTRSHCIREAVSFGNNFYGAPIHNWATQQIIPGV